MQGIYQANTWCGKVACWSNDMAFIDELRHNRTYEQDMIIGPLRSYVERSKVILDVGAHVGMHTLAYIHINPNVHIHAFEPQVQLYRLLKYNLEQNGIPYKEYGNTNPNVDNTNVDVNVNADAKIHLYNTAVGHINSHAEMAPWAVDCGIHGLPVQNAYGSVNRVNFGGVSIGQGGEKVKMIRLDDLNLESCDYIKMDVEGAEPLVIGGGIQLIKKYKPVVCFEMSEKKITDDMCAYFGESIRTIPSVPDTLSAFGYNIQKLTNYDNYLGIHAG